MGKQSHQTGYRTPKKYFGIRMILLIVITGAVFSPVSGQTSWTAPASANQMINPDPVNNVDLEAGKQLYNQLCSVCHGNKGKGDGIAGMTLNPRPANFTKSQIQEQSDGALYWKITEGRPPMATYKSVLTEEQRWQLVSYLRTFRKK